MGYRRRLWNQHLDSFPCFLTFCLAATHSSILLRRLRWCDPFYRFSVSIIRRSAIAPAIRGGLRLKLQWLESRNDLMNQSIWRILREARNSPFRASIRYSGRRLVIARWRSCPNSVFSGRVITWRLPKRRSPRLRLRLGIPIPCISQERLRRASVSHRISTGVRSGTNPRSRRYGAEVQRLFYRMASRLGRVAPWSP